MKQNEHEKLTIKVNGKYVEIEDKNGKVAKARCNPVDKFDIYIGIKVALEKLEEEYKKEKEQFRPYVCGNCSFPHDLNIFRGHIGERIKWNDEFGETLRVGDTVKCKYKTTGATFVSTIFKDERDYGVIGASSVINNREGLVIVKLPRQKKTKWCTLIETYEEMKGK